MKKSRLIFFITLAAGIGYIRYRDQGYGKFKTKDE